MLPDLLVASVRRSEIRVISNDLRTSGPAVEMLEPMDALWLASDDVVTAGKDPDGGAMIARLDVVDRRLTVSTSAAVGQLPCALEVIGGVVFAACYSGGRIDTLEPLRDRAELVRRGMIDLEGAFPPGPRPSAGRQEMSHPHDVTALNEGSHALICDLGADRLYIIDVERLRITDTLELPKGSGPRKALVDPDGSLIVVCELDSTIRYFQASTGRYVQTDCLPTTRGAREHNYAGDIVSERGMFIVANRGNSTLAAFAVEDGRLRRVFEDACGGEWPASLDARAGVVAVANEHSGSVAQFQVSADGLAPVASSPWRDPSLVRFAP